MVLHNNSILQKFVTRYFLYLTEILNWLSTYLVANFVTENILWDNFCNVKYSILCTWWSREGVASGKKLIFGASVV